MQISQDELLGEGDYADTQRQSLYDDHALDLPLNVQDRIEEEEKKIVSFSKVIQCPPPKKNLRGFLTKTDFGSKYNIKFRS